MDNPDPTNGKGEARAKEDDSEWFTAYTHRRYRLRDPFGFEFRQPFDPEKHTRLVIVRRSPSGDHTRAWIRLPKAESIPDNDDAALEALFNRGTVFDV